MFSHNGPMALDRYSLAATEHGKRNCRVYNQKLFNGKDRKYSLRVGERGRSLLSTNALFLCWFGQILYVLVSLIAYHRVSLCLYFNVYSVGQKSKLLYCGL